MDLVLVVDFLLQLIFKKMAETYIVMSALFD